MSQVPVSFCCWVNRIGVQSRPLLGAVHVHVIHAVYINGVLQGPQASIHHSHSRVHHFFRKLSHASTELNTATDILGQSVTLLLSRFYSPPSRVTWVLRVTWVPQKKGEGEGGTPTLRGSREIRS